MSDIDNSPEAEANEAEAILTDLFRTDRGNRHHAPFQWDVKVRNLPDLDAETLNAVLVAEGEGAGLLTPERDARWQRRVEHGEGRFWAWAEGALSFVVDGLWAPFEQDAKDWEFSVEGRSGGYIVLHRFQDVRMDRIEESDIAHWPVERLRLLAAGIEQADGAFTRENAKVAILREAAYDRLHWEEEWNDAVQNAENAARHNRILAAERAAEEMALARPDLAPRWDD